MAGTPLSLAKPYVPRGTREFLWIPDTAGLADPSTPTRAEMEAGTNITNNISEWAGFTISTSFVDAPNLASRVTGKAAGPFDIEDTSITFNASKDSADARDLFVVALTGDAQSGYMAIFPEGDGPANGGPGTKMDVWPAEVGSVSSDGGIDDLARLVVSFACGSPQLNVDIPTSP